MKWSEREVFKRLRYVFPEVAHVLIPQVRNGTGYDRGKTRTMDALVVSTWPSRGLWMAGIEIKVCRSDWKKEYADPAKSAEFQKWCHYWYVAAPADVVPPNEVPDNWGLIEVKESTATITMKARYTEPQPPDLLLVCSILRSFREHHTCNTEVDDRIDRAKESLSSQAKYELEDLQGAVGTFEAASGLQIREGWKNKEIGKAVRIILNAGLVDNCDRIDQLRREAETVIQNCDRIKKLIGA